MKLILRSGYPVATAVVEERWAGRVGAQVEHATDGDGLVAAVVLGPQLAVDPRAHAVEHGGAGGCGRPRDPGELVDAGAGERHADVLVLGGQHVDAERADRSDPRPGGGGAGGREAHQRG